MSYQQWKTEDVCRWLEAVSLGEHRAAFNREGVTGADLMNLDTNYMISELRIQSPIQHAELRRALDGLVGYQATPTSTTMRRSVQVRAASELTLGLGAEPLIEISAQSLLDDGCRHSGWLRKRGINLKNWKRRYHVLRNGCLYYFKDELAKAAKGQFSLNNYRVELCPGVTRLPWAFQLVNSDISKRTWFLVASSEHERRTWMEKIEQDIAEFCAPGTAPRPAMQTDCFSDDENDGMTEDQIENEMYATAFNDSTPFDQTDSRPPPPVAGRSKSLKKSSTPEPQPVKLQPDPTPRVAETAAPPSIPLPHQSSRQSQRQPHRVNPKEDRGPPPALPSRANEVIYDRAKGDDSGSDTDDYLQLMEDGHEEKRAPLPSHLRRQPSGKTLVGGIKMLPTLAPSDLPRKPAPYKSKMQDNVPPNSRSPADSRKKPVPVPRSKQTPHGPPTLPPKDENSDSDGEYIAPDNQDLLPKAAFRNVDRDGADDLLRARLVNGLYLFRESANAGSEKVLSVWTGDRCRHYKVFYEPTNGYSLIRGVAFPSLRELVEHYRYNLLPKSNYKLSRPFVV